jgi:hypothetical protein
LVPMSELLVPTCHVLPATSTTEEMEELEASAQRIHATKRFPAAALKVPVVAAAPFKSDPLFAPLT